MPEEKKLELTKIEIKKIKSSIRYNNIPDVEKKMSGKILTIKTYLELGEFAKKYGRRDIVTLLTRILDLQTKSSGTQKLVL